MIHSNELKALDGLYGTYGVKYAAGEFIVHEHEPSSDLYVILRGAVEFSVADPETMNRRVLRTAHAGEIFGEISCFSGLPRTASAQAVQERMLLRFQRDTAVEMIRTSPQFAIRLIQTMGDRLRRNTEMLTQLWNR